LIEHRERQRHAPERTGRSKGEPLIDCRHRLVEPAKVVSRGWWKLAEAA
jgi:hypothetical protein